MSLCLENNPRVVAVVVTFNPEPECFSRLLCRLVNQVDAIVVVDNCSQASPVDQQVVKAVLSSVEVAWVNLEANRGLGAAQNIGIDWAVRSGATHCIFFDQDSLPDPDMVDKLFCEEQVLLSAGVQVAAVCPDVIDENLRHPSHFIAVDGLQFKHRTRAHGSRVSVDLCPASGMLVRVVVLKSVGVMREDLFIDQVDIEWIQRAKSLGYITYGTFCTTMRHRLGDNTSSFLGRTLPNHKPFRRYYMFRNAVWLYRQPYISWKFKLADAARLPSRAIIYVFTSNKKVETLKYIFTGLAHGVIGRMGRYDSGALG
jgi:rhamnosyltransferase